MSSHHAQDTGGLQAGTKDNLVKDLPGFPDGISRASDGNFWLSIVVPPVPLLVKAIPYKYARWAIGWLPNCLRPSLPKMGLILKVRTRNIINFPVSMLGTICSLGRKFYIYEPWQEVLYLKYVIFSIN